MSSPWRTLIEHLNWPGPRLRLTDQQEGLHTPASVHYGLAAGIREQRVAVLAGAYAAHPERFVRVIPQPPPLPTAVWINPPAPEVPKAQ